MISQVIDAYNQQVTKTEMKPMSANAGSAEPVNFKDMVIQFNKLSQMNQAEILSKVAASRASVANEARVPRDINGIASATVELRRIMKQSEHTALENAAGRASIADVATSAAQASNAISLAVKLRDKMQEGLDKLFNMNV